MAYQTRSFVRIPCTIVALAGLLAVSTPAAQAVIVLTPGGGATNVTSAGLDVESSATARSSIAPNFPGLTLLPGADISVVGTGDLGANYVVAYLNDDTGYSFQTDNASNRGWIPDGTGVETATFTFASPIRLAGIDFLTLFTGRTSGSYLFEYSTDNQGSWSSIATVTNNVDGDTFRQGISFDTLLGVTDARLVTAAGPSSSQLFMGEVDFFTSTAPLPIPEPSTLLLLGIGFVGLACRRNRS